MTKPDDLVAPVYNTLSGITKREYFAGLAMHGLMASIGNHDITYYGDMAHDAVMAADKLIEELNKTQ